MGNTGKAVVVFSILVFLQIWCGAGQVHDIRAVMSVNGFQQGEEGGPATCDGQYHSDDLFLVSMASKWFGPGVRCGKMIRIVSLPGIVQAIVVDECADGCGDNEISTSAAVWKAMGLDPSMGEVPVLWSDV
ncbi:putative ripening-related protein 6 [Aegilops tauschii subsp. strangulata]|uniref:Uncharacterized protein n=1 Tax=Aegilops tauschii TaxID=37682 RepID=M8C1E8_AEGTA|nr:putative ripening-related protein 6 [Aegilops tauschii subsp. strangulata]